MAHHSHHEDDSKYGANVFMVLISIFFFLVLAIAYVMRANMWDVPVK